MKLKLKNPALASSDAPADAPADGGQPASTSATPTSAAPKLNLKFKAVTPGGPLHPAVGLSEDPQPPKQKRKYTKKPKVDENGQPLPSAKPGPKPKKRPLEDGEEGAPTKRKPKPTLKSLERADSDDDDDDNVAAGPVRAPQVRPSLARTQSVKLSLKPKGPGHLQRAGTAILKMKAPGKPPPRPPGVGYDSEAEDAEEDPAIEAQFVLRMEEGPDCDLLRKAIEEKTLGKKPAEGGPRVQFRFLDRDGRRTVLTIQDRMYAATMVELPCVIESLKSWNKKDWVKTADVCQMLLVLGRVNSEEEAKKVPRPKTVDSSTHRYVHGLTPPMHWVRNRRFKQRKSYLDVERIESQANALLQEDEQAISTKYELIDSEDEDTSGEEDFDAQGDDDDDFDGGDYAETPAEEAMDAEALEEALAAGLMDVDESVEFQDANGDDVNMDDLFGNGDSATVEVETPVATSHDVAMQALTHNGNVVLEPESAVSTPAAATSPEDEDDDEGDDDDDDEDDDEVDPEAAAKQERDEVIRQQIKDLEDAIAMSEAQLATTGNVLYQKRVRDRIALQEKDRQVKLSLLGERTEDD
ncbi:hypothetical protein CC80DRAFT_490049 [Byssothecium circinans]|uniref:TAFII55 protein conserved region domain-containing protein n=1 Tax=Byssothecium circinans TaxID=147558 RepID=A0A6A5U5D5_9PLEO|nr:hypothetical protein CC80DRAFT_490049 [Byssothecium circinans]